STRVFYVWGDASQALYAVPIRRASAPVLIADKAPAAIEETPDGAHLVFLDDGALPGRPELYSASLPPAPLVAKLSGALARDIFGDVLGFALDPTGARVAFFANVPVGYFGLFSAAADGSAGPLQLDTYVWADESKLRISADGIHAVYA